MGNSFVTIAMVVVIVLLFLFMFRNQRKRQKDAQQMQSKLTPGTEVMTNFGLFGTIVSVDESANKIVLEIAPGTDVTVHRQVVTRVVEPTATDGSSSTTVSHSDEASAQAQAEAARTAGEPEFGERIDPTSKTDE